ncbi:MAG: nitroreductase family protein [Desulfobacteraceae bacterium]|nr:MAG: nitroreductase family protein [Desulfobacteraceae bacterium]
MEFLEVVEGRRSIRYFTDEEIPEEDIRRIVAIGTLAPNAGNRQDWRCLVIKENSTKNKIKELVQEKLESLAKRAGKENPERYRNRHSSILFARAPVVLVFLTTPYRSPIDELLKENGYSEAEIDCLRMRPDIQTISAMVQNILLSSYMMGYGTCWMVAPNIARHEIENCLGIRPPWSIAAFVAMGRASQAPEGSKRKPLDDVIEFIR